MKFTTATTNAFDAANAAASTATALLGDAITLGWNDWTEQGMVKIKGASFADAIQSAFGVSKTTVTIYRKVWADNKLRDAVKGNAVSLRTARTLTTPAGKAVLKSLSPKQLKSLKPASIAKKIETEKTATEAKREAAMTPAARDKAMELELAKKQANELEAAIAAGRALAAFCLKRADQGLDTGLPLAEMIEWSEALNGEIAHIQAEAI